MYGLNYNEHYLPFACYQQDKFRAPVMPSVEQSQQYAPNLAMSEDRQWSMATGYQASPYVLTTPLSSASFGNVDHCAPAGENTVAFDFWTSLQMSYAFPAQTDFGSAPSYQVPQTSTRYHQGLETISSHQPMVSDATSSTISDDQQPDQIMHLTKGITSASSNHTSVYSDDHRDASASHAHPQGQPTEVDALMQTLQELGHQSGDTVTSRAIQKGKVRKHHCPLPDCQKAFLQPTHLKIHLRSHTGEKPYRCGIPSCGAAFSQLGNQRTHERRHRGEQPVRRSRAQADSTSKTPAQQYQCKLDECKTAGDGSGKAFCQLGNLKAHMNKFHKETLARLCTQFAHQSDQPGRDVSKEELELKEYFKSLYRNCNKGIKGRGKGRRVVVVM